jgi:hypothetical protein
MNLPAASAYTGPARGNPGGALRHVGIERAFFRSHPVSMNKTRDRLTGVTFAVLLQMGFVAVFIYSLPLIMPAKKLSHEIIFFLPRLREVAKPASGSKRSRPLPSRTTQPLAAPPVVLPPVATPPAVDLRAFGNALFGCAPENLNNLTAEQRAHCSGFAALPRDKDAMTESRSLVKDLPRRQAELAARNRPARVPCVSFRTQALAAGHQDTGGMVDPLCVLNGLINGFGGGLPP